MFFVQAFYFAPCVGLSDFSVVNIPIDSSVCTGEASWPVSAVNFYCFLFLLQITSACWDGHLAMGTCTGCA